MKYFLTFFSFFVLVAPVLVFAQFKPLVGIPGVDNPENFDQYLQAIYATAIGLAALLAVIKIVIAGVKWMVTDIVTAKGDAKKDIEGAVFGLLVILGAVLILYIINPNIGTVDLTFTKVQQPAAENAFVISSDLRSCMDSDACSYFNISCALKRTVVEVRENKTTFDCGPAIASCLGNFEKMEDGEYIVCMTTAEQAAAGVETPITRLLDEATLRDNLVSDASIITGFSIKAGVSKTYYLIDLPGDQGPAGSAVNNPIINKLTPVCNLVAESEANPEIKVAVVNYNEEPYAGCVRPS
jgi:type IV secretory pathway VirB2 component (pilin)